MKKYPHSEKVMIPFKWKFDCKKNKGNLIFYPGPPSRLYMIFLRAKSNSGKIKILVNEGETISAIIH